VVSASRVSALVWRRRRYAGGVGRGAERRGAQHHPHAHGRAHHGLRTHVPEHRHVSALERGAHTGGVTERDRQGGLRAGGAQIHLLLHVEARPGDVTPREQPAPLFGQLVGQALEREQLGLLERNARHVAQAVPGGLRHTHAIGRQHTRQRMEHQRANPQRARHTARVLTARPTEHHQGVVPHVVATCHRHPADGLTHGGRGHFQEALGHACRALLVWTEAQAVTQLHEPSRHPLAPQRERKARVGHAPQEQRHVGERQLGGAGVPIAERARPSARALGPHHQAAPLHPAQRATTCRHGVDVQHGHPQTGPCDAPLVDTLELTREAAHIGAGAAHVEADGLVCAHPASHVRHRDGAPGRPGQHRIPPTKASRLHHVSTALHQLDAAAGQGSLQLRHISPDHRREVRVHRARLGACQEPQRVRHLVGERDPLEADLARQRGHGQLVFRRGGGVEQRHGQRLDPLCAQPLEVAAERMAREAHAARAIGGDTCGELDDALVERLRPHDVELEQLGAGLVTDTQQVPEALRDDQRSARPTALQQGVGGQRGAHAHVTGRNGRARGELQQLADDVERRTVRGQLLRNAERAAVWITRDSVTERAAAVEVDRMETWAHRARD
jgi:hypothetical protein